MGNPAALTPASSMIRRLLIVAALCALPSRVLAAPLQLARPAGPLLIADVRLEDDPEAVRVSIVIRDGRISEILPAGTPAPPGMRLLEGDGALCLPAFVDAFTRVGCETPSPVVDRDLAPDTTANVAIGMRVANRKGIQPAFRAVDVLAFDDGTLDGIREEAFGVLHSAPSRELLAGQTALVTTGGAAVRDRVLRANVGQSAGFRARGRGYPGTLMGSMAQLRQFFLDAGRHGRRLAQPEVGRRVPYDADLDAGARLIAGEQRVWARADTQRDIERWLGLAEEFGLQLVIVGGRDAWKLAERLQAAEVGVVLGLDWGDEPDDPHADDEQEETGEEEPDAQDAKVAPKVAPEGNGTDDAPPQEPGMEEPGDEGDEQSTDAEDTGAEDAAEEGDDDEEADEDDAWIYEEPLALREERRRLWEEKRDGALRLAEAGVSFCFGSLGESQKELRKQVQVLVDAGLDPALATQALTAGAAELLGETARFGRVEPGLEAHLALWTDAPWSEDAALSWLIVDGESFEFEVAEEEDEEQLAAEVEASGTWTLSFKENDKASAVLHLKMAEDGTLTGTAIYSAPMAEDFEVKLEGTVSGDRVRVSASLVLDGFPVELGLDGKIDGDLMTGKTEWENAGGTEIDEFRGVRTPEGEQQ